MPKSFKTYKISCGKCANYILTYHKYGNGKAILRLYFHRIMQPENIVTLIKNAKLVKNLKCENCTEVLGVKDYQKGKYVFRMRKGFFHKKLVKK